jgi:hypothetical protein
MKNLLSTLLTVCCVSTLFSCASSKAPLGLKPYSSNIDNLYKSEGLISRATAVGVSTDLNTSEKIATLEAKSKLASEISQRFRQVTESYTLQGNADKASRTFEDLILNQVDVTLNGVRVKDRKVFTKGKGKKERFVTYITLEIDPSRSLNDIYDAYSKEDTSTRVSRDAFFKKYESFFK